LIVDDQGYNIKALQVILASMKVDVDVVCAKAFNGQQAVDLVKSSLGHFKQLQCGFSLILMDCNMPIKDGYQATEEIRVVCQDVEQPLIVAVTGHTEQVYIKKCETSGMNKVFSKPVDIVSLKKFLVDKQIISITNEANGAD